MGSVLCFGLESRSVYGLAWDAETLAGDMDSEASGKPILMKKASVAIVSVLAFWWFG